ncbi:MAG: bifunctional 5,10-methylenetetrahydrofolate dehydrogenase/5,10-methenyltetrahydrofolate cyclohydrolase [Paludibacteraceae bacterium]|nr:bifunctional 5,10-methylenetetrahydrofolate dehydrogenase/5,10-methenyltetrahydrofolate cyclohydrolase [Paludibacteraceae bacterium]
MIFDGKKLAEEVKASLRDRIAELGKQYGRVPCLSVLLVGDDYGSQRYVASCEKNAALIGMTCRVVRMAGDSSEDDVLRTVETLNSDNTVDGILIQMPLPKQVSQAKVVAMLNPAKDVDGVTDTNVAQLWKQKRSDYTRFCVPCTPRSAMRILEAAGVNPDGCNAVVVGRSNIVGLPVTKLLMNQNATVTVAHSHTKDLPALLRGADIIVAAIGQPKFITAEMVSEGAVIVDVGINSDPDTGKMCGDVDFEHVADKCSLITPVPGGVGPLTICSLMENTIDCFLRQKQAN